MKNVLLQHGSGGNGENYWFPYIKKNLDEKNYTVSSPNLPNSEKPDVTELAPYILEHELINENTILIGHSAACPIILALLEKIKTNVQQVILVSGFIDTLDSKATKESYDWDLIKSRCVNFVIINSDNDPWGCDQTQGLKLFEKLGGNLIIRHGEGHMGSLSFNQPYKEFPLLLKLIE